MSTNPIQNPIQIRGLDHILLVVTDMERAIGFYQSVVGCTLKARLPQYAMAELAAGASGLDLVDASTPEGAWAKSETAGRNLDHFCLAISTSSEQALRAHLAGHAVQIVEERVEDGFLSLYITDPSGNVVELKAPAA